MPTITYIHASGETEELDVAVGMSVMQGATSHGIDGIVAECGGNAMCATCHVYVEAEHLDRLPPITPDEDALLEGTASERRENSRLSCQIPVTADIDGLVVRLPERQV
jgi:2Fe-2S ferredoxin